MRKRNSNGSILIEAIFGLFIVYFIVQITLSTMVVKILYKFDIDDEGMMDIWENENYLSIYNPHTESILDGLLPEIEIEEGIP